MAQKLKNPMFLTPSKAGKIVSGNWDFLQSYLFKLKLPQTPVMELGTLVHEMFYSLIRTGGDPCQLIEIPDEWKTKKECGLSVADQKKKFFEDNEKEKRLCYPSKLKEVVNHMRFQIELNPMIKEFTTDKCFRTEVVIEDNDKELAGILDIMSNEREFDIKTTSKAFSSADEFIKWNEGGFAVQQVIYEHLVDSLAIRRLQKPLLFIVIQLSWPFKIMVMELSPELVDLTRKYFWGHIYPQWRKVSKILKEHFIKESEIKEFSFDDSVKTWKKLHEIGVVKHFGSVFYAKPTGWHMSQLQKEVDFLKRQFSKVRK